MLRFNRETKTLFYLTFFSLLLVITRVAYTEKLTYIFLLWNLFLAAIPFGLTKGLSTNRGFFHQFYNVMIILTWMAFFPNAPYIFTDLFHLRYASSHLIWFDTTLILTTAWTGMLFGYLSLLRIEAYLQTFLSGFWSRSIVYCMLFISAFGVYIGRYLRFNSWDIVSNPFGLFYTLGHQVISPFTYPRLWGMTLVFGMFLSLIYSSLHLVRQPNH